MISDSNKDAPNNILKDSQNTALGTSQTQSDAGKTRAIDEALVVVAERKLEKNKLEKEVNGPKGLEPTRYGDWESKGRCYDF